MNIVNDFCCFLQKKVSKVSKSPPYFSLFVLFSKHTFYIFCTLNYLIHSFSFCLAILVSFLWGMYHISRLPTWLSAFKQTNLIKSVEQPQPNSTELESTPAQSLSVVWEMSPGETSHEFVHASWPTSCCTCSTRQAGDHKDPQPPATLHLAPTCGKLCVACSQK